MSRLFCDTFAAADLHLLVSALHRTCNFTNRCAESASPPHRNLVTFEVRCTRDKPRIFNLKNNRTVAFCGTNTKCVCVLCDMICVFSLSSRLLPQGRTPKNVNFLAENSLNANDRPVTDGLQRLLATCSEEAYSHATLFNEETISSISRKCENLYVKRRYAHNNANQTQQRLYCRRCRADIARKRQGCPDVPSDSGEDD